MGIETRRSIISFVVHFGNGDPYSIMTYCGWQFYFKILDRGGSSGALKIFLFTIDDILLFCDILGLLYVE